MQQDLTADKLMQDLRAVIEDAEALLKATAGQAGEKVDAARSRAEDSLRQAKMRLQDMGLDIEKRARAGAAAADNYVHEKPWHVIGAAAGLAFLIGYLLGRR